MGNIKAGIEVEPHSLNPFAQIQSHDFKTCIRTNLPSLLKLQERFVLRAVILTVASAETSDDESSANFVSSFDHGSVKVFKPAVV